MESINLNNYEAFFLDYLEENLSAENEQIMFLFLDAHPHLQIEFSELTGISFSDTALKPNETVNFSKEMLKADPALISAKTIDQWMVDSVENKLTQSENAKLLAYISKHKLESKFMAYQATVFVPDTGQVYGDKADLKRESGVIIPLWMKVGSAAAAIALLVFVLNQTSGNKEGLVADDSNPSQIEQQNTISLARQGDDSDLRLIESNPLNTIIDVNEFVQQKKDLIVLKENGPFVDSSAMLSPKREDNFVDEKLIDSASFINPIPDDFPNHEPEDEIAVNNETILNKTVEEEPYKIFTKTASNLTKQRVSYTRTLNAESDEYVAYHFKIGKFEFERKKSKK